MITARPHRLTPGWQQLLAVASLAFLAATPSASANCFKNSSQSTNLPAAATAALLPDSPPDTDTDSSFPFRRDSIVGLWNVTFTSGGQTVDVAFDAWHPDGTEIMNDYTNPIEGNVWTQTGPRTFKLKHPSWSFDNTGTLLGTVIIRETVTVSHDRNSYKGHYTYDVYDTAGAFVTEYTGTLAATRIRPE